MHIWTTCGNLASVFSRRIEAGLTVDLVKCEFARARVTYLEKVVGFIRTFRLLPALLTYLLEVVDHPASWKIGPSPEVVLLTLEKETLALVLALKHFEVYLGSPCWLGVVMTNHNPLVFCLSTITTTTASCVGVCDSRLSTLELGMCFDVINVFADALSWHLFISFFLSFLLSLYFFLFGTEPCIVVYPNCWTTLSFCRVQ